MTGKELKKRRKRLGMSARELAVALGMESKWADRTIRKWESGQYSVPGPVAIAVECLCARS